MRLPAFLAAAAALLLAACTSPVPNRDPVGERFPTVAGESLEGELTTLPDDLTGAPALLLIGYVQDAQFDVDRWLLGLLQAGPPATVIEVPAVRGWVPRLLSARIDQGMREGIPPQDWGSVVTVYDDADAIARFTGTELPRNARVLLLDPAGEVVWFHDRGYSAGVLLELLEAAEPLAAER